jgi:hypothetical protein
VLGVAAFNYLVRELADKGMNADGKQKFADTQQEILANASSEFWIPSFAKRAVSQGVGEMFGYALSKASVLKAAGLRVPAVMLTGDAPLDSKEWFSKPIEGGWCNSKHLPRALPIYYLKELGTPSVITNYGEVLHPFTKACPIDRSYYADFPAEREQDKQVLAIAEYDSPQRLLHYAYRAFLYATYPHGSNALAQLDGKTPRLWLLDHEKILLAHADSGDIARLHRMIKHYPPALDACGLMSQISEAEIKYALSGIPSRFWQTDGGIFQNEQDAAEYFKRRLSAWKMVFRINRQG